jgi:alkanesulfonate monooxygenase SsuD/methylene tetrahydromethanopterin reductase-like flavin-dependent oxidoreductase (luciferase family)
MLAGRTVEWKQRGRAHKIRFLNPELDLINIKDPIPVHISAFGPRARRLAAKRGARWLTGMRSPQAANAALADMQKAWSEAGRERHTLYATAFGCGCVLRDGEPADSPRAKAQAGPAAAIIFHSLVEEEELGSLGPPLPPALKPHLDAYREIYRSYRPEDAR